MIIKSPSGQRMVAPGFVWPKGRRVGHVFSPIAVQYFFNVSPGNDAIIMYWNLADGHQYAYTSTAWPRTQATVYYGQVRYGRPSAAPCLLGGEFYNYFLRAAVIDKVLIF